MVTIGFIGGGQLAELHGREIRRLGLPHKILVLDPEANCTARNYIDGQIVGAYDSAEGIAQLAAQADVITYEIERSDFEALSRAQEQGVAVHPRPEVLEIIKDKYKQKIRLTGSHVPAAHFFSVGSDAESVRNALKDYGAPVVLKVRNGAYDGRGNYVLEEPEQVTAALEYLSQKGKTKLDNNLYMESVIDFKFEISVVAARDVHGHIEMFPIGRNDHRKGQLYQSTVPAILTPHEERQAHAIAGDVLRSLDGVGVFGVEMFVGKDGVVYFNEVASRVHNSGHYTIDACNVSQFVQHIRAVTGEKLEQIVMPYKAASMINILGGPNEVGPYTVEGTEEAQALGANVYIYGKKEVRPDRKMGHLTVVGDSREDVASRAAAAREKVRFRLVE